MAAFTVLHIRAADQKKIFQDFFQFHYRDPFTNIPSGIKNIVGVLDLLISLNLIKKMYQKRVNRKIG